MYFSYVGGYLIFLYYLFIYPVSPHCRKLQIYPKPIFPNICWLALTNSTLHRPLPGENQPEFRSRGWISFLEKLYFFFSECVFLFSGVFLIKKYIRHIYFIMLVSERFVLVISYSEVHYLHLLWLIWQHNMGHFCQYWIFAVVSMFKTSTFLWFQH